MNRIARYAPAAAPTGESLSEKWRQAVKSVWEHGWLGQAPQGSITWHVADDVAGVTTSIVNAYLVGRPGAPDRQWTLVDAGLSPASAGRLRAAARERFGPASRPAAILLTHGHFDHVGALATLAHDWDAPIYAHPLEKPYLTGQSAYPPPDPSLPGAMAFLSRFYPRGPIDVSARLYLLPDDGTVPTLPGWKWIATPGHSPGHVSYFRQSDGVLLAGDAFVTVAQESLFSVMTQVPHVHRPPAYYTADWMRAHQSIVSLAELRPAIAATGHGRPVRGDLLTQGLNHLLRYWSTQVPAGGRYSLEPAETSEQGVVHVPPAVPDPRVPLLACCAIVVVSACILRARSHAEKVSGTDLSQ
jgi:glyoxylase-like metal-dependent hydrolase (beta-lactamase superfamily II)